MGKIPQLDDMPISSSKDQGRILRTSMLRKKEIFFAVAWRGLLYSAMFLVIGAGMVYIFSGTASKFFLNPNLKLSDDQQTSLYFGVILPAFVIGWLLAVNNALHARYSHFRIALLSDQRRPSWIKQLLSGTDRAKKRHR